MIKNRTANFIDKNCNERISEVLDSLPDKMNVYELLFKLNKMYNLYGNSTAQQVRNTVLIRYGKVYVDKYNMNAVDKVLTEALKTESNLIKLHYKLKVLACLFEKVVSRRENNRAADFKTDKNGWDVINDTDKILYQVKYGSDLILKNTNQHLRWAKKNGYKDYQLKVLWLNTNTKQEVEIDLKNN